MTMNVKGDGIGGVCNNGLKIHETSEQFLQQLPIVAAMLLGATLDQVIAAEWTGEGSSTYTGAHY